MSFSAAPIVKAMEHALDGEFIVLFDKFDHEAFMSGQVALAEAGVRLHSRWNINGGEFLGVAGHFDTDDEVVLASELPGVRLVEQDSLAFADFVDREAEVEPPMPITDRPISLGGLWGLDRADGTFDNNYRHATDAGENARVYILDTGIRLTHNDYGGRAEFGNNFSTSPDGDRHGHGTHCGCTATGGGYGIAGEATVVDCKVLGDGGSGSFAGIISGVEWSNQDCAAQGHDICVQSMSLGGGVNQALNDAVDAVSRDSSFVVVSAGNGNTNSCNQSPASAPLAYTVNSATSSMARSSFSNYGPCSNSYSAGSSVLSCGVSSDTATATMSGTSMSCPHVAGHAAACITKGHSTYDEVKECLDRNSDEDVVSGNPSGPNIYTTFRHD